MKTEFMLLAIYNKPRLSFSEVCECLNMSINTARKFRAKKEFPVPINGSPLSADIRDVANYLDELRSSKTL